MKNQATKHNFLNFAQGLFRLLQTRMRRFDFTQNCCQKICFAKLTILCQLTK